jgi:hypothetical protein
MTPSETAELLALAAAYDQRTVGTADALAWAAVLEHDADPDNVPAYLNALRENRAITASGEPTRQRPVHALAIGKPMPRPDYGAAPRKARELLRQAARERAAQTPADPERSRPEEPQEAP